MNPEKTDLDSPPILEYARLQKRPGSRWQAVFYCLVCVTAFNGMVNRYLHQLWHADHLDDIYFNRVVDIGSGVFVLSLILGILSLFFVSRWRLAAMILLI